jgi:hypothetical protein
MVALLPSGAMSTRATRLVTAGVTLAAALAWLHLLWATLRPTLAQDHWRTPSYWVAPRLALDGRTDLLYDDEAFAAAAIELGSVGDIYMPNPPVTLVPLLPLALLDELAARNLVLGLNLAATLAAAVLLGRAARLTPLGWAAAALLLATFEPLRHGIVWGQLYGVVLLAITVAALAGAGRAGAGRAGAWSGAPGAGSGVALGAAAVLKYPFPLAAAVGLAVAGRARAAVTAGLVLAGGVAASIAAWGFGPWQAWLAALGPWSDRPVHAVTALQMPRGLLTRLFERDPEHSPSPIVDAPVVGDTLWLAVAAVILAGTALALWRARRGSRAGASLRAGAALLATAVAVPAALLVSPYVDDYTFVLTILPLFVAAIALGLPRAIAVPASGQPAPNPSGRGRTIGWLVVGAAALLLGAAIPFREADPAGFDALLWYPRVYGTALLWVLLVALALSPRGAAPDEAIGRAA